MSILGQLNEFCIEAGNILSYPDHIAQYFIINNIAHGIQIETKCKAILHSIIGEKTRVLKD